MTHVRPLPTKRDPDAVREGVRVACAPSGDEYWLDRDDSGEFPQEADGMQSCLDALASLYRGENTGKLVIRL